MLKVLCKCSRPAVSGWIQRWALALCLIGSVSAQTEKPILLRNTTIQTLPPARGNLAAQAVGAPVSGLYLIQFERPIQPAERAALTREGAQLLRPVPQDAFVARLGNAELTRIKALPFVRWIGPYKPEYKLHTSVSDLHPDGFENITILLPPNVQPEQSVRLERLFHRVARTTSSPYGRVVEGILPVRALGDLTASDAVLWIERTPTPKLYDAVAAQIIGGEALAVDTEISIHELGFDGDGVTVAVADSGLDIGDPEFVHPDIEGRVEAFFHYGLLEDASDEHGHGTHVTGIIAGDGAAGETDEFSYLYGLGIAPKSRIVAQRIFDGLGGYHPPESFGQLTRDALLSGAEIGSNSWGEDVQGRYDIFAMEFDALVRDGDPITAGDQPYILEFSAGNAGPGERTIGTPAVAKNVIATGASQNNRFDFFIYADGQDTMADFSSRGPAEDGRIKPDVVAPGTWIASLQSLGATDQNAWLPISPNYQYQGGTSQSGPQVSGAAAVFVQYYRELHSGQTPSPAMVKAALINSAIDMDNESGTSFIPNKDEGWGRIDLTRLIGSARRHDFVDQTDLLATGQVYERRFVVASYFEPLKVTLAYTDVPGFPAAIPALVNDLDLEVISPTGTIYRGNQFIDGESAFNPTSSDSINNVEAVHVEFPEAGEYLVRIRASNIPEDARRDTPVIDQDFALVISGDIPLPGQGVLAFDRRAYTIPAQIGLKLIDFDLAGQPNATITLHSTSQSTPMQVTLLPSGSIGVFTGAVATASLPVSNDGALHVAHGDEILGAYQDADPLKEVIARSRADLVPPVITQVASTNRFGRELVSWRTDEAANSVVFYGTNGTPSLALTNQQFTLSHELIIDGLVEGQTYQYYVKSTDEAGNVSIHDNNGSFFSFVAQPASVVLLVDAYTYEFLDGREDVEIPVTSYTDALDQTGISYEVWDVETEGSPTVNDLAPFRVVIWRINDSFWENANTITPAQQTVIEQYLDRGGGFLLGSMEILSRLGNVPFRTNVLQVAEFITHTDPFGECPDCHEDHGAPAVEAAYLESSTSGIALTLDFSSYPVYEFGGIIPDVGPDLSDVFVHTTNAAPILVESNSALPVGIRTPRTGMDSTGRVVFLSFPLDAVPLQGTAPNSRAGLLRSLISFLVPGVNGLGTIAFDNSSYTVPSRLTIEVADSDLIGQDDVQVHVWSDSWTTRIPVELEATVRPGVFRGSITLVPDQAGSGRLPAQDGDLIYAEYADASASQPTRALAEIDTGLPAIFNILLEPDYTAAVIEWETDEFTDALVQFGESPFLSKTAYHPGPSIAHSLILSPLLPDRIYYYQVVSRDSAGNTVIDDNNGQLYTFRTLTPVSPPWSDDLEGPSDWSIFEGEGTEANWELGVPNNQIATGAHSPTKAWGTNLDGSSASLVETYLISPAVDLQGGNQATLTFWHNYDFFYESEFKIGEGGELQIYTNSLAQPITLATYTDFTSGWEQVRIDLTPYLGNVVQFVWGYILIDFSFEFYSYPGWLIDDVSVTVENVVRGNLSVTNNIADASFTLSGPMEVDASGRSYINPNAPVGTYTCTFHPVPHYITPEPQNGLLSANSALTFQGQYTFVDSNSNSMPDSWEQENFGEISPARDLNTDTDQDGASDHAEWIAGTSPVTEASRLILAEVTILSNNRVQLTWPSVPGKSYRLLGSPNARVWEPQAADLRADSEQASLIISQPAAAAIYFYKIEVVQ